MWATVNAGTREVSPSCGNRETPRPAARVHWLWVGRDSVDFQAFRGSEQPRFAHAVEWEYEPRTFVLEQDDDGRVTEAFTPDFYLPEQDLYLEVTVMKQSLVTRKNRKLRKLRVRYPEVNVKLFYKRDLERLAARWRLDLAS
jgi:hypothetical protein